MDLREAGNATLVKASHSQNAQFPMDVREAGNATLVKAPQL